MSKHLSDQDCFYVIRRLLPQAESDRIQQHLNDGCPKCNKLHKFWSAVAGSISPEFECEPPEDILRLGRAVFDDKRATHLVPWIAQMIPLVFDSFLAPRVAAIRGDQTHSSTRHLTHRTRSWQVDVRLDSEGEGRLSVIGQILRSGEEHVVGTVFLMQGDRILARTSTNQFGEFQLQSQDETNLKLYLDIRGWLPIGINLPDTENKEPTNHPERL